MKRYCSALVCFVFLLAVFGFRCSNLFGMGAEEGVTTQDGLPLVGDWVEEESPLAEAGKASMPSSCWEVNIDYDIHVLNIGNYEPLISNQGSAQGTVAGEVFLDAKSETGGEYTLTPSGEGKTLVDGTYTVDNKSNISLSPIGIPGGWLEDKIVSLGAAAGLVVEVRDGGVDANVKNPGFTKPSRVTFTRVNGQSLPSNIAPVSYQFDYKGADIIVNGQEFSSAEIQLTLKITFTKKNFRSIKCKETGSIDIDLAWEVSHPYCAKFADSETGSVTFSLRSQPSNPENVCEYLGEGKAYHREDWSNCVFPDGTICSGNAVCVVSIGVVGKVPDPVDLGCGAGSLLVDFSEVYDCSITGCPMSTLGSFPITFSLQFPYKNNVVVELPAYSGGVRFKLHLK
jgi:hypothetical protein